jgi:3-oxoacyl-[acyl-carrier-protein] synthase-1
MKSHFDSHRIGVIIGTSTTGIEEATDHLGIRLETGAWSDSYDFADQELGDVAKFVKNKIQSDGPAYSVSTACTSATKAVISAGRLIKAGLIDAAICGGVDGLSKLTVNGFHALNSVSAGHCSPFGEGRDGINIGEGGALFIVSNSQSDWQISGMGESSDAYHISSPSPTGEQAERAIMSAIQQADLKCDDIDLLHLHGTGTELNDLTEAQVMMRLFGDNTPAMSTKGMTGHTLGAAGGLQIAINLISMTHGIYAPHIMRGERDTSLEQIKLTGLQERATDTITNSLCASYAFGGSNAAVIISRV